ncbi:hypothetical protein [Methylobacterium komagatae]|uniref:hypothetical protein n=1 Tax=Methylobacterium komagatae TaxID=374425 RepID=UPI00366BED81
MNDLITAMRTYVRVVEAGSFTAVAAEPVPPSRRSAGKWLRWNSISARGSSPARPARSP